MADDSSSSAASDTEEKTTVNTTIADDLVVTKYKMASDITNRMALFLFFSFFLSVVCLPHQSVFAVAKLVRIAYLNRHPERADGKERRRRVHHSAVRAGQQPHGRGDRQGVQEGEEPQER